MLLYTTGLISSHKSGSWKRNEKHMQPYCAYKGAGHLLICKDPHKHTHAHMHARTHKKEKCGEISWLSAGVLPPVSTWWLGLAFQPWGIRRQRTQDCMFVCVYVCVCVGLRWGGGGAVLPEARSIIVSGLGVLFQPWSASVHGDLLTFARMLLKLFSQPKLWHTFQ